MSTISGSTDINVKYQRLAAEYVKVRNQVPILKNALTEEQAQKEKLQSELQATDTALRKLRNENESLVFRNDQLAKRVEALQSTLDSNNAMFTGKNKKKHKEANLRLFGESARFASTSSASGNDNQVLLEQELDRKLTENGELHSKLFEMERQHENLLREFTDRLKEIEMENDLLRQQIRTLSKPSQTSPSANSDYSSADNTQSDAVPATQKEVQYNAEDARLYASALVGTVRNFLDGFTNFLTLLEQRSTMYPYDASMEPVPSSIQQYCRCLLDTSSRFKAALAATQELTDFSYESDLIEKLKQAFPDLLAKASSVFQPFQDELLPLMHATVLEESRSPWNNARLEELSNACEQVLTEGVHKIAALLNDLDNVSTAAEWSTRFGQRLFETARTFESLKELKKKKVLVENHLPTASKRLKCVNECIEKCVVQFASTLSKLQSMCSDEQAMRVLQEALNQHNTSSVIAVSDGNNLNGSEDHVSRLPSNTISNGVETTTSVAKHAQELNVDFIRTLEQQNAELSKNIETIARETLSIEKEREHWQKKAEVFQKQLEALTAGREAIRDAAGGSSDEAVNDFYANKIGDLVAQLQHAEGRAMYYKAECTSLVAETIGLMEKKVAVEAKLSETENACSSLKDELESTRTNYESQMRSLYEHLSAQDAKIVEQSERIGLLQCQKGQNPTKENGASTVQSLRKMVRK
ncbi:Protein F33E11.3 [Aphelenchoides avenae]|nr:Protein F33E11.3 [Aphelenchus avenae]